LLMDILLLPDLFLRQLMRKIGIKDRMSLRLTCRTFAKLVSESHAGYFESGSVYTYDDGELGKIGIGFEGEVFEMTGVTEYRLEEILHMRKFLFQGVSFGKFSVTIKVGSMPLTFALHYTDGFSIGLFRFYAISAAALENTMQFITRFPRSKYTI
ncbi:hypothetical protein PMAYCL1PPCAC_16190, partial [Pristionchus mayeri]